MRSDKLKDAVKSGMPAIIDRLRLLEKYELTCCAEPGEDRDDSLMRFSLKITRSAIDKADAIMSASDVVDEGVEDGE